MTIRCRGAGTGLALALLSLLMIRQSAAQSAPAMSRVNRVRLAEAFRLADKIGDSIWPHWKKAPFAVLLVTTDGEFLVRHRAPTSEFHLLGYDPLLKSRVYHRARVFSPGLLATFPAVGNVPTIVVGEPETTAAKTSTPWVVTLLHEHFHQLQYSQPDYYPGIEALGLAHGDQSGMWMLNYPFPYDKTDVMSQCSLVCRKLTESLRTTDPDTFRSALQEYLKQRSKMQTLLSPEEYRYFSFQLWQEGIARYTECQVAQFGAARYQPDKTFRSLPDYTSYADVARSLQDRITNELLGPDLDKSRRALFYPIGAAEGLLLDRENPRWRSRYFAQKFDLLPYFVRGVD